MGSHLGRPTPPTVASFRGRIGIPRFCLLLTMIQMWGDLPPSIYLSMWVHQSTLPHFCCSHRLWSTQRAQRFLMPWHSWRMQVRLPDEIFMISCISVYAVFGSFLIRDSTLDIFWGNGRCRSTTTVMVLQRSCSRHELSEPPENSGFGRRLISKTVF